MIKIENVEVMGWEAAIRGMRNPLNSWAKSDSHSCGTGGDCDFCIDYENCPFNHDSKKMIIGPNDLDLMKRLRAAGTDHGKFMRMIVVSFDIVAPLYMLKEFDTYKVGTVANSCSTMHKIHSKPFVYDDFSHEHLSDESDFEFPFMNNDELWTAKQVLEMTVIALNEYREKYLETKDKKYWWQLIQILPSSYNQRRTVMLNYEVLANMYKSRKNHKLDEWVNFCKWIETLPYSELITGENKSDAS